MRKFITSLLLLSAMTSIVYARDAKPRIFVQVPDVTQDDIQLNTIANTIYDTTRLILSQLNQYEIHSNDYITVKNVPGYCGVENIDNFISGKCEILDNGSYEISLYTYDREENRITVKKNETADSALAVFDVVDSIVFELLSEFSGQHIAFGSLQVLNTGSAGTYRFSLDGTDYAEKEEVIENLLIGNHVLKVEQVRMNGPYTVIEKTIVIEENKTLIEGFSIPEMLASEKEMLSDEEAVIEQYRDKKSKSKEVDAAFNRILALLKDTSYSAAMGEYKQKIELDYQDWLTAPELTGNEDGSEETSLALAEEKREKPPRKRRNLDKFFNIYFPVEVLGGNNISTGLGTTLYHRKLDMKVLGGWSSYEKYYEEVDEDIPLNTFSVGAEVEHHPLQRAAGLYYGGFFRYNWLQSQTTDDSMIVEELSAEPVFWTGFTAGIEVTFKKAFTLYGNSRMFVSDFTFDQPGWTFALGAKLRF